MSNSSARRRFKRLSPDDAGSVAELDRANPSPWNSRQVSCELASPTSLGLAIWDEPGGLAAFIIIRRVLDEAEILKIAVAERSRRQGVGCNLLARAIADLHRQGIKKIFLEVRASNQAAISLYQKCKFSPIGRRYNYYNDPVEDAICMAADLTNTQTTRPE